MSEQTVYTIENTSSNDRTVDNRGRYTNRTVYFGNLPRDYGVMTFYKCLLVSDIPTDVFGISQSKCLKNVELRSPQLDASASYVISGADMVGSKLENVRFGQLYASTHLIFDDCDFGNSVFENCVGRLYLENCNLSNAKVEGSGDFEFPLVMSFRGSDLEGCTFEGVNLGSIRNEKSTDFSGAIFKRCSYIGYVESDVADSLFRADIYGIFVNDYRFKDKKGFWYLGSNSNLQGADFRELGNQYGEFYKIVDGFLRMCNLRDSILDGLYFSRDFYFAGSDFRGASLRRLYGSTHLDFAETDMRGASFSFVYLGLRGYSISFLDANFDTDLFTECIEYRSTDSRKKLNNYSLDPTYFLFSASALSEELLDVFGISVDVSEICGPNARHQIVEKNKNENFVLRGSKLKGIELVFLGKHTKIAHFNSQIHIPNGFDWSNSEVLSSSIKIANAQGLERVNFSNSRFKNTNILKAGIRREIQVLQSCDFSNCVIDGHLSFETVCLKNCEFTEIEGHTLNFGDAEGAVLLECSFARCDLKVFHVSLNFSYQRPSVEYCDFSGAKIYAMRVGECDFSDTNFSECHFTRGEIEESEIERCDFRGAVFSEKFSFDSTTFTDCVYDQNTKMNLEDWQWEGMTYVES